MRRILKTFGIITLLSLLLTSCSKGLTTSTRYTPAEMAQAIISNQSISILYPLFPNDDYYSDYISKTYHLETDSIKDGAIYYSVGFEAYEIAVFLLTDDTAASHVKESLESYKERRADAFRGYAPVQTAMIENSIVAAHGDYVALLICGGPKTAETAFMACFSDEPPLIDYELGFLFQNEESELSDVEPDAKEQDFAGDWSVEDNTTRNDAPNDRTDSVETNSVEEPGKETVSKESVDSEPAKDNTIIDEVAIEGPEDIEPANEEPVGNNSSDNPTPGSVAADNAPENTPENDADGKNAEEGIDAPAQPDVYDPDVILNAWNSGDSTKLSEKNKRILDACIEIIVYVTKDTMSHYEKELAIHDWLIDWVSYDEEAGSNSPYAKPDPDNENPYGAIFGKKAICSGYTSTFQLFMDMLGIECITVNGLYSRTGEKHAWNMVRIDGEWYNVDVTWDDPIGGFVPASARHKYFNVTSQYMRETGHQWDDSLTPVADAGKLYLE